MDHPEIIRMLAKAAANGSDTAGFAHRADAGLSTNEYVKVDSRYADKTLPEGADFNSIPEWFCEALVANYRLNYDTIWEDNPEESIREFITTVRAVTATLRWTDAKDNKEEILVEGPEVNFKNEEDRDTLSRILDKFAAVLGLAVLRGITYFHTNHCTGGSIMTAGQHKYMRAAFGLDYPNSKRLTGFLYRATHAINVKTILSIYCKSLKVESDVPHSKFSDKTDLFLSIRINPLPAGVGKIGIAYNGVKLLLSEPCMPVIFDASDIAPIISFIKDVRDAPARYHVGSRYLTGLAPIVPEIDPTEILSKLKTALITLNKGRTLLSSPALDTVDEYGGIVRDVCKAVKKEKDMESLAELLGEYTGDIEIDNADDLHAAMKNLRQIFADSQ